jgi:hypothetical protein
VSQNGRAARAASCSVAVEFGAPLARLAKKNDLAALATTISAELTILLDRLGLDGEVAATAATRSFARPVRVAVDGRELLYPPSLVRRAWIAAVPNTLHDVATREPDEPEAGFPAAWLRDYAAGANADWHVVAAFVERLVHEIVLQHPSSLLGREQLAASARRAGVDAAELGSILGPLLELGVSAANASVVGELVREGRALGRPSEDTVEAAFAHLRSHVIELHVHPESLRRLLRLDRLDDRFPSFSVYSSEVDESLQALFRGLERTFFARFGFLLPRFDWMTAPSLREGMMSIRIDTWSSPAVPLVMPGERLVVPDEATDAALERHAARGRPALHPVTGARCIIVPGEKDTLEADGIDSWGPIDFVVLNIFAELTARADRLFGMEEVEHQLAWLRYSADVGVDGESRSWYSPLVHAALAQYSLGDLTRILRAFVAEQLSIQNLPAILERLLQYDTVPLDQPELVLLDDRLPTNGVGTTGSAWSRYYEFVRKQLKSYLSDRHAWVENIVVAYVLEPDAEARILALEPGALRSRRAQREAEWFRDAVWEQVQLVAAKPAGQTVLTSAAARPIVRALLAEELPDLPVLSFSELRPDVNVQPIGKIGGRPAQARRS